MAEQVLIEFVGDTTKLEPAIDLLQKAGTVSDKDAAAFKKLNTESTNALKNVATSSKTAIKSLGDVEKSATKLADTFQDEVAAGIQDALDEAGVTVEEFDQALKDAGISATGLADNTEQVTTSTVSLKKELKNINAELANLKIQGKSNSAQYLELKERAGELKDTLADVNEEVARAGSDTRGFDNLIQLASGVTAGFAVAQGSMALFGAEGEEVQKALLKVNAAMAILQGLQQIQAIAAQKNFQSLTALVGIEKIQTLQTQLDTAAQSENIVVKNIAIVTQKALNAVLAISPLGLALIAVAAVAAAWAIFSTNAKEAAAAQKTLNDALAAGTKHLEADLAGIQAVNDLTVANAKLRGESTNQIIQREGVAGNARLKSIQSAQIATAAALKDENAKRKLSAEDYQKLIDQKDALDIKFYEEHTALEVKSIEFKRKLYEDDVKSYQAFVDAKVLATQKGSIDELRAQITAVKTAAETTKKLNPDLTGGDLAKLAADTNRQVLELSNQIQIKILENEKFNMEAKLATIKEGSVAELELQKDIANQANKIELQNLELSAEHRKAIIAENAKEQLEFDRQIHERQLQGDLDAINTRAALSKQGSADEFSAKLDALRVQNEIDVNAKGITDQKKLLLEAEYQKAVIALTREFSAQTQTETINTKQAQINKQLADLQKLSTSETNADLLKLKKDAIEQQAQLDIVAAHATINNEELLAARILEIRAKAKADKLAVDQQAAVASLAFQTNLANAEIEIEKKRAERILNTTGFNFGARQKAAQQVNQFNKQQLDNEFAQNEELHNRGLISEEDYLIKKAQLNGQYEDIITAKQEKEQQIRNQIIQAGFQILTDGINAAFDIGDQKRQADLAKNLAALDAKKQQEVDNKNLTQAQISNIDERYKLKEQQLRVRAFEADKRAKRSQAIITGALGVLNAIATAPTIIAGLILAAGVVATTAIQIAKINSAPPPAFKKGTRNAPKGYKWVGEEGPELIWSKGGEVIYPHKQSMQVSEAWRGGSLAHADSIIRGNIATPNNEVLSAISVNSGGHMVIDYDRIGKSVAENIDIPAAVQVHNNFDENGLQSFMVSNGNRIQQRSKRHSWG